MPPKEVVFPLAPRGGGKRENFSGPARGTHSLLRRGGGGRALFLEGHPSLSFL